MVKRTRIKLLIVTALFTLLLGMAGIHAYAAESGFYDGTWNGITSFGDAFTFNIEGNKVSAFTVDAWGETWSFPSASVDLKSNSFISTAGNNKFEITFDPSDNKNATGYLIAIPDNPNGMGGYTVVSVKNTTAPNPDITTSDKTAWVNILPEKDQELADSLACLNDMAWNGKNYVIAGRGKILVSTNVTSWKTAYSMDENRVLYGIVWNGKEYTAIGTDETDNSVIVMKSPDGTDWKVIDPEISGYMLDIAANSQRYAAVGDEGVLITSSDGVRWSEADLSVSSGFSGIIWAHDRFVAVGDGIIAISSDGSDWNVVSGQTGNFKGVTYYNGQYCIFERSGKILTTPDFKKWSSRQMELPSEYSYVINAVCSNDSVFVAVDNKVGVLSSTDMSKWTFDPLEKKSYVSINNIVYVNGRYFIVGPAYVSLYTPPAAAVKVVINGSRENLPQAPYMSGSAPMLPVKAVFEAAGLKVKTADNRITITNGTKKAILTVNSISATLNRKSTRLEAKVVLKNGVVFAPLNKIVTALGGTYTWDLAKKTVTIKFKP